MNGGARTKSPEGRSGAKVIDLSAKFISPKEFGRKPDPKPAPTNKITADEVAERIKDGCLGWSEDVRKALRIPADRDLYVYEGTFSIIYSTEPRPLIDNALFSLYAGEALKDVPSYAIAIFQKTSNTYLILIDTERKIVIREQITALNDPKNPVKPWANVVASINAALQEAEDPDTRAEGAFAFVDEGTVYRVIPKKSA